MPDNTIIDQIKHYQKDIIKCPDNSKRMIRCIERLTVLPVTIKHLQETGVGRSVNELRKCGGEVGAAANSLVCKWKNMVKDQVEESSDESDVEIKEESEETKVDVKPDSKYTPTRIETSQKREQNHSSDERKKSSSSSQKKIESSHSDSRSSKNSEKKSSSKSDSSSHRDKTSKSSHSSSLDSKSEISHRSRHDSDSRSHKKSRSSHGSETERNGSIKNDKSHSKSSSDHSKHSKSSSSSSDRKSGDSKRKSEKEKSSKRDESSHRYNKYDVNRTDSDSSDDTIYKPTKKRKTDSEEEEKYEPKKQKSKSFSKKLSEKRKYESSDESNKSDSDEEIENSGEECESRHNTGSENEESSRDNLDDNSSNDRGSTARSSPEESGDEKSNSAQSSDSEENVESPNSEEYVPVKIKKEKESPPRDVKSHNHSKHSKHTNSNSNDRSYKNSSNSKENVKIRKERNEEIKIKNEKDENANKQRHKENKSSSNRKEHKSSSSRHESKERNKPDKKVKVKIEKAEDGSIDCESGASFGDALLGLSDTKKKPVKRKSNTLPMDKSSIPAEKSAKTKPTIKTESRDYSKSPVKEPLLLSKSVKLEPLDVDLKSTLPEISPNYKPLPHYSPPTSPAYKKTKLMSQEDALSTIMSTKNQRTKVYSGNKSGYTKVPSLFELCTQVLRDNIDALEYTGGVPYDLLKPVLDRATADQLFQLEHHNPYLIEDTDGLWQFHCNKDFRSKKPEEFETWRELYLRLLDEREKKLVALKANITQSMAKSTPIRQTKLAYVDTVVKPPRNVARQQMKHGTAKAVKHELVSKAMVGAASSSPAPEAVAVPAPPVSSRASNAFPIPNFLKKKKAPLMAKALQLIKGNRFKR